MFSLQDWTLQVLERKAKARVRVSSVEGQELGPEDDCVLCSP